MSISMHSSSVPVLLRNLNNVLAWLDKAQAHAEARKFDPVNYLGLRLAPDMLPFAKQIQILSDTAKGCAARLAGVNIPKFDGQRYLEHWALPNFYFHLMTAYALLRQAGVDLGKQDYLKG